MNLLNPKFFYGGDVEAHMNPKIVSYIANWAADLVEKGIQVVLSTHSKETAETIVSIVEGGKRDHLKFTLYSLIREKAEDLTLEDIEKLWGDRCQGCRGSYCLQAAESQLLFSIERRQLEKNRNDLMASRLMYSKIRKEG